MRNRRLLTSFALLTTALTLSLTACGPDSTSGGAGTSAGSAAASAPGAHPSANPSLNADPIGVTSTQPSAGQPSAAKPSAAKPTAATPSGKPTAKPSAAKPTPSADCTANAKKPGHTVINATVAWGNPDRIGANATKFICGPDVPNDGYYEAVAPNSGYNFAPGAKATLVGNYVSDGTKAVSVTDLLTHIDHCTQNPSGQDPYSCYGNMYDITVNGSGLITSIAELYHP
ncbi:hypothetical protein P3T36_006804 [Kitasatospora sp. MAP12-15]|uniref:hypothetical protein n=1 Tax=unclassified Kitasatospora TaxID=2633591 RepID=UPI00247441A1|nr:hypothetical protein [Kitasatospora sp. MAP12-44]MDH6112170.1 hypothetical protein [Kitasatospora sp. MAP12-44]